MTFEELKKEADKLGYNLLRKRTREKFLPCPCGSKKRKWYTIPGVSEMKIVCPRCGRMATSKTRDDAREAWNKMIKKEQKQKKNDK